MTIAQAIAELNRNGVPTQMTGTPTRIAVHIQPQVYAEPKLMTLRQFIGFCNYYFEEKVTDKMELFPN